MEAGQTRRQHHPEALEAVREMKAKAPLAVSRRGAVCSSRRYVENGDPKLDPKPQPNHREYIRILRRMTPEQRLAKAFDLSEFSMQLFIHGLRKRFPDASEEEFAEILKKRLEKCHNRNW